jgi:hypothetical protein
MPKVDVPHLILIPREFPGPLYWRILNPNWKTTVTKFLLIFTAQNMKHIIQTTLTINLSLQPLYILIQALLIAVNCGNVSDISVARVV